MCLQTYCTLEMLTEVTSAASFVKAARNCSSFVLKDKFFTKRADPGDDGDCSDGTVFVAVADTSLVAAADAELSSLLGV